MDIHETSPQRLTRASKAIFWRRESFASPIIVVSVVLLALVGVASLSRAGSSRSLRVFAGVVAVLSLLAGVMSLPVESIRISQVTDTSMPSAGEVAVAFDNQEGMIAADDMVMMSEEAEAVTSESLMLKADSIDELYDYDEEAMAAEPTESKPSRQLKAAPKEAARFAQPEKRLGEVLETEEGAKSTDKFQKKAKNAPLPMPESQPSPAPTASAEKPQPAAGTLSRSTMRPQQLQAVAGDVDKDLLARDYATWFYEDRFGTLPTSDPSATTIVWLPIHQADQTGNATVYFQLPQRPSSFRAIVESHADGRLGAGELLIDSHEP